MLLALAGLVAGLAYAAISVYWGAGGRPGPGVIGWMASRASATRPRLQVRAGRRS
jgi:uncharacterized membrane protein YbhN (UPF0104 family)